MFVKREFDPTFVILLELVEETISIAALVAYTLNDGNSCVSVSNALFRTYIYDKITFSHTLVKSTCHVTGRHLEL